ncbi:MAG: hypothetical protein ABS52_01490 [Gemmatimonadetes bacterium SCN 70-22]|nr:MAG: hypothetical protein ABS52_01490 [Gemmatimonadetes bacterium SCN 70-22]
MTSPVAAAHDVPTPRETVVLPPLPVPLTPLVGRDDEVATLRQLLATTRLLTLTGAGGSGKTRLAIEVASQFAPHHRDGVAWLDLAPLADPQLLASYIGAALHLEMGARPAVDSLLDALHSRELLLVVDNCEHLVDACATLLERLITRAPGVRVLATSREALGIAGERAWLVPTLATPAATPSVTPAEVIAAPAGRLFVERAQAAHAAFRLTPENAGPIASICRRLDGLPLAIELAAARVRALSPDQIAARLDKAFHVLTSAPRAATSRHRTLEEAIDWSYALLEEGDRRVLERLSVFVGDFSLEAAESVCAPTPADAIDILDRLVTLVDKSLVVMIEGEGTVRYRLLETIRQYAAVRLAAAGGGDEVRERHARFYIGIVREAEPHFITGARGAWMERVVRELDNLRAALAWTRDHAPLRCLRLAGSLSWVWYSSGLWFEGRRWLEEALALPEAQPPTLARGIALLGAGILASLQAQVAVARPWLEEAASILHAEGDVHREAYALAYLGVTMGQVGDLGAEAPARQALAVFRERDDLYGQRLALLVLVTLRLKERDLDTARSLAEEAAQVARRFGAPRELGIALQILGTVAFQQGDVALAGALMGEALEALQRDPQALWIARVLELLAMVAGARRDDVHAARLYGAAHAHRALIGSRQFQLDQERLAPFIDQARQSLGAEAFDRAWSEGERLPMQEVIAEALERLRAAHPAADDASARHAAGGVAPSGFGAAPSAVPAAPAALPAAASAPSSPPALEVDALGPLEIRRDGVTAPPDVWRYARGRELLLFLLVHPDGCTREQIGLAFWPESTAAQVKNSFHVLLHHLRRSLGRADLIAFDRNRYRMAWELGVRFDAAEFEARATEALPAVRNDDEDEDAARRLREALSLYRGDFLSGEDVGDWHLAPRDRLHRLYVDSLMALGTRAQRLALPGVAAEWYRRVIQVDPLNEGAHRRLMRTLARAGQRAEAILQFERLTALLRRELEATPERRTMELLDALRRGEAV